MDFKRSIPGWLEASEREKLVRSASYLPVTETILGFEVMPMTLTHWNMLFSAQNPILTGGIPRMADVIAFIWLLSPNYGPRRTHERNMLAHRFRQFTNPPLPWFKTCKAMARWKVKSDAAIDRAGALMSAIRDYVNEVLLDVPPRNETSQNSPEYYCDCVFYCTTFAREYGWSEREVMQMPMKRIFQYLKALRRYNQPDKPLFNPSDKIISDWLAEKNRMGTS